jgi:hyperosmotically inducible periplasmic protein
MEATITHTVSRRLARIVSAIVIMAGVGCAGSPMRESTGEYVDDTAITTKVKAKFAGDKAVSVFDIHVETFKGVVQLSGFVASQQEETRAVELARSVPGVKGVEDNIRVKSS